MINAKVISAQHPKNVRTIIQNMKGRLSSPKTRGGLRVFLAYQTINPYTSLWDLTIVFYVWYNQNEVHI
jgi:hypothetical protein